MFLGRTVFSQLMDFLPRIEFDECVRRYDGNWRVRTFSCLDQFLCMAFAQLTFRESLRDIETCLRSLQARLYHAGIRGKVARSTLADANESRDWRIFADFAQVLIARARRLYATDDIGLALGQMAYALDSTTIDLCLTLFPWAHFRKHKGAIKLHTLLDLRGSIPSFVRITHGKVHDVHVLDHLVLDPGAFYVMDRAYLDFARLYSLTQQLAFFVTRAKRNLDYRRRCSRTVDPATGVRSDQTIVLAGIRSSLFYPDPLRRVTFCDPEGHGRYVFLTNNFTLPPQTIAQLYKCRWQVELFFKWIKQHLRIKAFYGISPNAVKTQVWIAIAIYVLVAIVRRDLGSDRSLAEILQILSLSLFEKTPLLHALCSQSSRVSNDEAGNQLNLFDF
jgi:hypothetical protein